MDPFTVFIRSIAFRGRLGVDDCQAARPSAAYYPEVVVDIHVQTVELSVHTQTWLAGGPKNIDAHEAAHLAWVVYTLHLFTSFSYASSNCGSRKRYRRSSEWLWEDRKNMAEPVQGPVVREVQTSYDSEHLLTV